MNAGAGASHAFRGWLQTSQNHQRNQTVRMTVDNNNRNGKEIDWPGVIFDPDFMAGLDRMAAKRFVQPVLAEEATTAIIESLSENDWARLRAFGGKSAPTTFAWSVAGRAMEDFARRKFGRPRPPQWLQEMGQVWVRVWRMLCLERQWPETITSKLSADFVDGLISEAIRTIKQKIPRCGEPGFSECCVTELGLDTLPEDNGHSLDQGFQQAQRNQALALVSTLLQRDAAAGAPCPSNQEEALPDQQDSLLEQLAQTLSLTEDDRLLLALSYEDGLSSRKIADMLGTSAATVQRRLQSLRTQLQQGLASLGLADGDGEATFEHG